MAANIEVASMSSFDAISRRRIVGCGVASLAAFPLAARAGLDPTPRDIAGTRDAANRLSIPVTIDGRGPFHFVIDTGADRTVLADDIAAALRLASGSTVSVQGIARSVDASTVHVSSLEFGHQNVARLETPVLPRAWLGADGYLGLDAINGLRVAFDFKRQSLSVSEPHQLQMFRIVRPDESVVRAGGNAGRLRSVDCHVDGIRACAFIDSGAEISVGNRALLRGLVASDAAYATGETAELTGVTGGSVSGRVTRVDRVHVGGLEFSDTGLVIADLQIFDLWDLAERPALFIGMDVLQQFSRVVVDYGRKEYRFEFASLAVASLS